MIDIPTPEEFERAAELEAREVEARTQIRVAELHYEAALLQADRRERIATAVYAALITRGLGEYAAGLTVEYADRLIAALDKKEPT